MDGVTFYSDGDVNITDREIRLGGRKFKPEQVWSFGTGASAYGLYRWYHYLPFALPFLLIAAGFVATFAVDLRDGPPPPVTYARDWVDYAGLLFFLLAAGALIVVWKARPSLTLTVRNKSRSVLGLYATQDEEKLREIAVAIVRAVGKGRFGEARDEPEFPPGSIYYADRVVNVGPELVWLMGKTFRVFDLYTVEVKRVPMEARAGCILPSWLAGVAVIVVRGFFDSPFSMTPDGLLIPVHWVFVAGLLIFGLASSYAYARFSRPTKARSIYSLTLWGRFGFYAKEVIFPDEALFSYDQTYLKQIYDAIAQALGARQSRAA